jgi:hypothetical protein
MDGRIDGYGRDGANNDGFVPPLLKHQTELQKLCTNGVVEML